MNTDMTLRVTEIQRFCMHDGPGLRTTVFLKGCPLRCAWCHNPETQRAVPELLFYESKCISCGGCVSVCPHGVHTVLTEHLIDRSKCKACAKCADISPMEAVELCGKEMSVSEMLETVERDKAFYKENGGVTLSGGEPLAQGEAAVGFLKACKERGLSTAVETCGYVDADILRAAIPYTDLFLWDIKDTDDARHRRYTGVSNAKILENLALADAQGAKMRLRCILVNGVNTDEAHYRRIAALAASLENCEGVEFLPYHAYGGVKAVFIGGSDSGRKEWIPDASQTETAKRFLADAGIKAW